MPGTPTTAAPATPTTPITSLLSTHHTLSGASVARTPTSVLARSAARHLLQATDPVLNRRVRREQLADLLARAAWVGAHQVSLIGQLPLRRQRRKLPPRADPPQRTRQRKGIACQLGPRLVGLILP